MEKRINTLILGSGGREHALTWKVDQSAQSGDLYIAPGNGGTQTVGSNVSLDILDASAVSSFVKEKAIDLLIVGPEVPLVQGLVDKLAISDPSLMVIGPKAQAAQLEGSKAFAKAFMQRNGIPTAAYREFSKSDLKAGLTYIDKQPTPIVLKADGLAAGKGVIISHDHEEAKKEFEAMLTGKFGSAGDKVVIESFLDGIEFSVFVLTDGRSYKILPIAKDYKRIGEGDTGLNTGGMGSISPVPFVTDDLRERVISRIIEPTIKGLQREQMDYVGFIFFGLIMVDGDPYVIEYNCRMGDPETQSVMPRLKSDFLALCVDCARGNLAGQAVEIDHRTVASIVMVSGGYPGSYDKGKIINTLPPLSDHQLVFHAGTKMENGRLVTNGGRVLAATSWGNNLEEALSRSNELASKITFDDCFHRRDIGFDLVHS